MLDALDLLLDGGVVSVVVAFFAIAFSLLSFLNSRDTARKQQLIQTQDLLLKYDENVMSWGAECISEVARLETILTVPQDDDFLTNYKAALLRISALVDQGRMFLPNLDRRDTEDDSHKPGAYRGHREKVLDLLVGIYDWGMQYEDKIETEKPYARASYLFHRRREFVAELIELLNTRARKETLRALAERS